MISRFRRWRRIASLNLPGSGPGSTGSGLPPASDRPVDQTAGFRHTVSFSHRREGRRVPALVRPCPFAMRSDSVSSSGRNSTARFSFRWLRSSSRIRRVSASSRAVPFCDCHCQGLALVVLSLSTKVATSSVIFSSNLSRCFRVMLPSVTMPPSRILILTS